MHTTETEKPKPRFKYLSDNHVLKWRNAMTVAVTKYMFDDKEQEQIEIRSFVKKDFFGWKKQLYFRDEDDFADFINALIDAAEKIENQQMLTNPAPELAEGEVLPIPDPVQGRKYINQLKIVHKWRNTASVAIVDNRGYEQIEIRMYKAPKQNNHQNDTNGGWAKIFYFKNLDDFNDFIDALNSAADKIEDEKLLSQPTEEV